MKAEEQKLVLAKKDRAKVLMGEVEESNKKAIDIKDGKKQIEKNLET
jgi:hypothetical protein